MTRVRSNDEREIPLWVIPYVIAKQIYKTGGKVYRISVKRTHWHHYNISVRTRSLPRELAPVPGTALLPVPQSPSPHSGTAAGFAGGQCT